MQKEELKYAARLVAVPTSGLAKELVELRAAVRMAVGLLADGHANTAKALLEVHL